MSDAQPILKWAGGKRQLLPSLLSRAPKKIATYYEPFIGGGALFFALANERRFERAVINDANAELINLYSVIQSRVDELTSTLSGMPHSEKDFYRVRAESPTDPIERAARTVYLNRTGFNGLYRVNRKGGFNVPFGRYANPKICNEPKLRAASEALRGVELRVGDFTLAIASARPGDFAYLDPPYLPVSATANFASYYRDAFGADQHGRLAGICAQLNRDGVEFLLSNSDTPLVREIFAGLHIESVEARRSINSDGGKRGAVSEVLVSGGKRSVVAA